LPQIESAQSEVKRIVLEFGFACKEHIASPENCWPCLQGAVRQAHCGFEAWRPRTAFGNCSKSSSSAPIHSIENSMLNIINGALSSDQQERLVLGRELQKLKARVRLVLPRFGLQRKVIEELSIIARNLYAQFQSVSLQMTELETRSTVG